MNGNVRTICHGCGETRIAQYNNWDMITTSSSDKNSSILQSPLSVILALLAHAEALLSFSHSHTQSCSTEGTAAGTRLALDWIRSAVLCSERTAQDKGRTCSKLTVCPGSLHAKDS